MRDCFIRRDERAWMGRTQRVTDFAAPFATDFQPEPWQMLQTVDEEVTRGILKNNRLVVRLYYAEEAPASELTQPLTLCAKGWGTPSILGAPHIQYEDAIASVH